MFKNKRVLAGISACLVCALLLTGTYAWQQTVQKTNEFIGTGGGVLHDDFNPKTGDKDVYVENLNSSPAFVRVKLVESMHLADNIWRPGPADEFVHTYETSAEDCGHSNVSGELFHDYFTWHMGGQKYYMPATQGPVVTDINTYVSTDPGVMQTPPTQIIKMGDYVAMSPLEQDSFIGWIYDTDGFAYWSQPLANGEVTGILLHKVDTNPILNGSNYYYAIDVQGEVVDKADLAMWIDGAESVDKSGTKYDVATDNAKVLLNRFNAIV